ncbi:MAG: AzlD domain-containing protein [Pseudomonadota bacterium]|jgi:branched-subunit amino acid transport protein
MRFEFVLACIFMTIATYFCRAFLTISVSMVRISPRWENYLAYIPFAVLTALVAPYLFIQGPVYRFSILNPWSVAGAITFIVSYRTRNLLLSVGVGMAVFWILRGI